MTAQILNFPRRPVAQVIPITAAKAERVVPLSVHELGYEALRNNYLGAIHGSLPHLGALEVQSRQTGNPEIARLALALLKDWRQVEAPCDVNPDGLEAV